MNTGKILPLESLRGIAAVTVAIFHFWNKSYLSDNAFVQHAPLMVDFFFVLSGFVIAMNYTDRIKTFSDLCRFQVMRFWRLYPLHLLTLFGFLLIECLKYAVEMRTGMVANNAAFSRNNGEAFLHNLFLTQGLFLDHETYNFPSWSISVEFFTYLVFGVVFLTGRYKLFISFMLMMAGYGVMLYYDPTFISVEMRFFRCIYVFFLGVIGYHAIRHLKFQVPDFVVVLSLILAITAVCFLSGSAIHSLIPVIFLSVILCFALCRPESMIYRVFSLRPLVYLGTISYSIYMIHAGIWWAFNQILKFGFKVPFTTDHLNRTKFEMEPLLASVVTIIGIAVVIGISHLTYTFVEDRFRKGIGNGASARG